MLQNVGAEGFQLQGLETVADHLAGFGVAALLQLALMNCWKCSPMM